MKKLAQSTEMSPFKREVSALFFLGVGVFIYLSLFSYHPLDPSFLSLSSGGSINNWGGIVGSYLADTLLFLFGAGAYFTGFFFLLLAFHFFVGLRKNLTFTEILLYVLCLVFVAVLFQLGTGHLTYGDVQMEAGGLLGGLMARGGMALLGKPGTYLLVLFGALLTFIWATHVSLQQAGKGIVKFMVPLGRWFAQRIVLYTARARKGLAKWREAHRAAGKEPVVTEVKINRPATPFTRPVHTFAHFGKPVSAPLSASQQEAPKPVFLPKPPMASALSPEEPRILERADKKKPRSVSPQLEFSQISKDYQLPPINLLDSDNQQESVVDVESLKMNARLLEKKLLDFAVEGKVTEIHPGPVITMYEFQPAPGVKLSRIANLVDDLSLVMGGRSVRIVAPLPNKPAVGIEIPNNTPETVWLKDIIADEKFQRSESKLVMALGKDIEGIPFVADLAKMPHLLVAGATGSGKSVSINSMILSLLYKARPEEVRLILVDPKMLELSLYEGIPHLLLPVVTEPKKAALALRWAVREMERRYRILADLNARHIINYNRKIEKGEIGKKEEAEATSTEISPDLELVTSTSEVAQPIKHEGKLPYIVIVIDELADLMMVSSREVEECITRLAQMARAAGIHLILATQRPSVDVITGIIKANFPARISFKVSSKHDSRTVLDTIGSERLLGAGDMLFIPPGGQKMVRVHGAFITEQEVGRIVESLKKQGTPVYDESILKPAETDTLEGEEEGDMDNLYDQAVAVVAESKQASISLIQRRLRVGYNRAARMIEKMEADGIVSPPSAAGHRQVLVSSFDAAQ